MGPGRQTPWQQRAWLGGKISVLLVAVVAGVFAIAHYAGWGIGPAGSARQHPPAAQLAGATAAGQPAPGGTAAASASPRPGSPAAGKRAGHPAKSPAQAKPSPPGGLPSPTGSGGRKDPVHFTTLPPGAALPSGAQCARWVRARPIKEDKGANRGANQVTGQRVGAGFFPAGDEPAAGRLLAPRINGDFTGTTGEILRWAACKWGIDQNIVFAQAAVESWWQQDTLGDWGTDKSACPPGHGLGKDGKKGQCPQSYGVLQDRYPYQVSAWPGIGRSTAMNADVAYAIWRSCYDGYETWLNNVPHGEQYHAGDVWGCVGRWFAGRWHTGPADTYVAKVKTYLDERIWLTQAFQQP